MNVQREFGSIEDLYVLTPETLLVQEHRLCVLPETSRLGLTDHLEERLLNCALSKPLA